MMDQDKHSYDYRMASAQRIGRMADKVFAIECRNRNVYLPLAIRCPLDSIIESQIDPSELSP